MAMAAALFGLSITPWLNSAVKGSGVLARLTLELKAVVAALARG